jgi:pyruvate dehydrogenase E2 component (dihydrolipoamide acetyltransferase)
VADFAGGPVGYLSLGTGKPNLPAVLVHGFGGNVLTWQLTIGALSNTRPVVAVDLPGHGRSIQTIGSGSMTELAEWLSRALEVLKIDYYHLVGHSMGGWAALLLARAAPARVASVSVLACGGLSNRFNHEFLNRLLALRNFEDALACACALFVSPPLQLEAIAKALLVAVANPAARQSLATLVETSFTPGLKHTPLFPWKEIAAPLQFIWGEQDTVIPLPTMDRLPPQAPLHILQGVGHLPHLEAATKVNSLLSDFFEQVEENPIPHSLRNRDPLASFSSMR